MCVHHCTIDMHGNVTQNSFILQFGKDHGRAMCRERNMKSIIKSDLNCWCPVVDSRHDLSVAAVEPWRQKNGNGNRGDEADNNDICKSLVPIRRQSMCSEWWWCTIIAMEHTCGDCSISEEGVDVLHSISVINLLEWYQMVTLVRRNRSI